MEIGISGIGELAKAILSSGRSSQVSESQVKTLRAYLQEIGEYEHGMDLEEIACNCAQREPKGKGREDPVP